MKTFGKLHRLIAFVLTLALCLSTVSLTIFAVEAEPTQETVTFTIGGTNNSSTDSSTSGGADSSTSTESTGTWTTVTTAAELATALSAGGNVKLGADFTVNEQIVIPEGVTAVLDLNGKAIDAAFNGSSTTNHIYALKNSGTLTITDTSAEKNGSISSRGVYNYGSLTLEAGVINAVDGNGGYAVNNEPGSTFIMNGGVVATTYEDDHASDQGGYDATALDVPTDCVATLNGGTITSVTDFTFAISAAGTLNIPATSTVVVEGAHGAISVSGGVTTIDAGTFKVIADEARRTDNVTYVSGGKLVINGGTFIGDGDTASGGSCVCDGVGGAVIAGGSFSNSSGGDVWGTTGTTITGGVFENLTETEHVTTGSTITNGGTTYVKNEDGTVTALGVIAVTDAEGNVTYYNGFEGFSELDLVDCTIKLIGNVSDKNLILNKGNTVDTNVTLDLNGFTFSRSGSSSSAISLTQGSELKIIDSSAAKTGKIIADTNAVWIMNGSLVIEGGTIETTATDKAAVEANAAEVTVKGGKIISAGDAILVGANFIESRGTTSTVAINGGEIQAEGRGIVSGGFSQAATTVIITDGKIVSDGENISFTTGVATVSGGTFSKDVSDYCSEGFEVKENADGTYGVQEEAPVYVAMIGTVGYETFAEALSAASQLSGDVVVEIYDKVTLNTALSGNYTSIKFVGKDTDAEIYLDVEGYITASGKKVGFESLILSKSEGGFITNAGFMNVAFGVYDVVEVTYTDCTFANGAYASSGNVTYTDCTFYRSHDKYGLWAYGDANIVVDKCVFDDYRGIKMYAEGAAKVTELTVTNTDFSKLDSKPAIVLTYGASVTLDETDTYSSTGVFELDLDGAPNGTVVNAPADITCKNDNGACGVLVDGKIYTTVADAAAVATEGSTVTLLHASTETVELAEGVQLNKNGFEADGVSVKVPNYVATVDGTSYETLQEALNAAAAGTGNVTVEILVDIDLTDVVWTPVTVSAPGYPTVTVNGNYKTITGLNDMLFAGTWAGNSGLIINDLTIKNSTIVHDENDAAGNIGVGAFIGFPQASAIITLNNCHLVDSTVKGGHWTGGLIGYAAGYAGTDGPVFMNLTIKDCSVTGSTITGKGSVGGIIGHATGNAWTGVAIETTTVSGNTVSSTGSSANKAGAVVGTIGAAGQATTVNGVEKTGGVSVSATVSDNDVTSNGTTITTVYGRQGTNTGMLEIAGGSYDSNPIEENVSYAAPAEGYKIVENTDGSFGVSVDPAYGKAAVIDGVYYDTLLDALKEAQDGDTVEMLADAEIYTRLIFSLYTNGENVTLDGNGYRIYASSTNWGTGNGKHLINVNCDNVTLKDIVLDCNKIAEGVNIYMAQNIVFDNVSIINKKGWNADLTVNGSTLTVENKLSASYVDVSLGKNVTTDLGIVAEEGAVFEVKTLQIASAAYPNTNLDKALSTDGTSYYSLKKVDANGNLAGYSNSLSRLSNGYGYEMLEDMTVSSNVTLLNAGHTGTLDTNGYTLTVADGKTLTVNGSLAVEGEGTIAGDVALGNVDASVSGVGGLEIESSVENSKIVYENGEYVVVLAVAKIGEELYYTFKEAWDAVEDGDTLTLLADVQLDSTLTLGKSVVIEGNGKKITTSDAFVGNASNAMIDIQKNVTFNNVVFDGVKNVAVMRAVSADVVMNGCTVQNCEHTAAQGLIRLALGNATIKDSKFLNNDCTMVLSFGYDAANETDVLTVDGCVFEGNTCGETAVIYFADGGDAAVTNTSFIGNTVTSAGNAATLYMGWGAGFEVKGCLFDGNTVTTSHATTKRFASAIFCDGCEVTNNVFLNNTATRAGETVSTVVAVAAYYGAADINGNYWNGDAPAFTVEYNRKEVAIDNYYTSYDAETGVSDLVNVNYAAKVGVTYYATLAEALAAAEAGETITLLCDVTLTEAITVPAGAKVTLDLNGKTISGTSSESDHFALITNNGDLTVSDSVGGGKITYTYTGASSNNSFAWGNYTIVNSGKLTVNSGTIENATNMTGHMFSAIDNRSGGVVTINGGTVSCPNYVAIRMFATSATADNKLVIEGGTVSGKFALWPQNATEAADTKATLIVNGGTVEGSTTALYIGEPLASTFTITKADSVIIDAPEGHKWVDGTLTAIEYVAEVGGVKYESLQAAIDAANGGVVTILADITLTETVTVAKGNTVTLDLAGYTLSMTNSETLTKNHSMILNKGTLTIKDSSDAATGKITYTYTGASTNYSYFANTITNEQGNLTVESGILENNTNVTSQISYVIDNLTNGNLGDAVLVVKGGTISSPYYISVRAFANSTTANNSITIEGGTFTGRVQLHDANNKANKANFTITGGTFNPNTTQAVYLYADGSTENFNVSITGGTFNGRVESKNAANGYYPVEEFITGGTYTVLPDSVYTKGDYDFVKNTDGTYGVDDIGKVSIEESEAALRNESKNPDYDFGKAAIKYDYTFTIPAGATDIKVVWNYGVSPDNLAYTLEAKNFTYDEQEGKYYANAIFEMSARNYNYAFYLQAVVTYTYEGMTRTVTDHVRGMSIITLANAYIAAYPTNETLVDYMEKLIEAYETTQN